MELTDVVRLLADGNVHSGEELGDLLGVSRTAVWKQLQKLEKLGVIVDSVKGKGYQIPGGLELLDADRLQAGLNTNAKQYFRHFDIRHTTESTNSVLLQDAEASSGVICLAEHQSAGRGRKGRQWVSPFGRNIYFSTAWEYTGGAAALEGLSLAVGVAIVRALKKNGIDGVQLKWPNDVLWQQQKLAGILLEMKGDAAGICQVVVGVGLNVHMSDQEGAAIDQGWASLMKLQPTISRNQLVIDIANELLPLLATFHQNGFAPWKEEWESFDEFRGKEVDIHVGSQVTTGTVLGVNETGALRLQTATGEQLIYGGEASLRRMQ